jgi:hypothetical protein
MRQEGLRARAEVEARRRAEDHARAERERAPEIVLGSFMTFGTLQEAQQPIVELGLVSPEGRPGWHGWLSEWLGRARCRSVPGSSTSEKAKKWSRPWQRLLVMRMSGRKKGRCEMWKFCPAVRRRGVSSTGAAPTQCGNQAFGELPHGGLRARRRRRCQAYSRVRTTG